MTGLSHNNVNTLYFLISSIAILIILCLFTVNRKLFYYGIIIFYPVIGQLITLNVMIMGSAINPSMLFGLIIFLLAFIDFIQKRTIDFLTELLIIMFGLYSAIIGLVVSPVPMETISWTIKIMTWMIIIIAVDKTFFSHADYIRLTTIIAISSLIVIISFFLSKFGLYGSSVTYETGVKSYGGGFSSGKTIAYYLSFAIPVLFTRISEEKRIMALFFFRILCALSFTVILLSFVRAPVVGLYIAFVVYLYLDARYLKKKPGRAVTLLAGVSIILFVIYILGSGSEYLGRWTELASRAKAGQIEKLGSGRVGGLISFYEYYFYKTPLIKKVFGAGLGASMHYLGTGKIIHNDYAEIFMGTGIIGFCLYIWILCRILRKLFYLIKQHESIQVKSAIGFSISSFFLFLSYNMTNVSSGIFFLSLWAINTGAVKGWSRSSMVI